MITIDKFLAAAHVYLPKLPSDVRNTLQNGQSYEMALANNRGNAEFEKDLNFLLAGDSMNTQLITRAYQEQPPLMW